MRLQQIEAITLFVADPQRSKAFYTRAFGVSVHFEDEHSVVFDLGNTLLNLLVESQVPELIDPAPMGHGARAVLTVGVEDTDAACDALAEQGVALLHGPVDRPWGPRTASFTDPDGHIWELSGPPRET